MSTIQLSAIMIVGICRRRAQRSLDALCQQTRVENIKIILVDLGEQAPPLNAPEHVRLTVISRPAKTSWAQARAAALNEAQGDIIAFIEDHSFARSNWAEELIKAFEEPWAAVGYSVVNANPQTYISRAGLISDYLLWMHPVRSGEAALLPGNNVAYRRKALLAFQDRLAVDLGVDFNIHEALRRQNHKLAMSSTAIIAHQNYDRLIGLLKANYHYCKLLAANRVSSQEWTLLRRILYIIGTPIGAPLIKILRIIKSLSGRRILWWPFFTAVPVIVLTFTISALGETLGYLVGPGQSEKDFNKWELMQDRTENE